MLCILAWQYTKSRMRRRLKRNQESNDKPTRKLTVRSGRVVPLSQALQRTDTGGFNSLDLSSLRSGESTRTVNEKELQYPAQLYKSDHWHASPPVDLEAQHYQRDRQRISDKVLRTLGESKPSSPTAPQKVRKLRGINEERQASITESLLKAYEGPPVPGAEPVELPASPLSGPIVVRELAQEGSGSPERKELPPPQRIDWRSNSIGRPRTVASKTVTFQSPDRRRHSEGGRKTSLPDDIQLPTPRFIGDRDSFRKSVEGHEFSHSVSFFSNSPSSSIVSQPVNPLVISPHTRSRQNRLSQPKIKDKMENYKENIRTTSPAPRKNRPPDIDTSIPNTRDSWFIDSSGSTRTVKDTRRGASRMSNRSDTTYASSDIPTATHWTFGNARALSIAPSVVPQALSMPPVQRPKSKYRRRVKNPRDKSLPVLPKSQLSH